MFESLNYRGLRETALLTVWYGECGSNYHWQQIPKVCRPVSRWWFRIAVLGWIISVSVHRGRLVGDVENVVRQWFRDAK